jgi:hypothetical protein
MSPGPVKLAGAFGCEQGVALGQLKIYLPDYIESKARKEAKAKGKSVNRWIADQVVHSLKDTWPKAVVGCGGGVPRFSNS